MLEIIIGLIIKIKYGQASYAAIEIVPSKDGKWTDGMTRSSVSNSYLLCQNMKNAGESLNGTTVLPHLITNTEWANTDKETGIMNLGANSNITRYTQTAGLTKKYVEVINTSVHQVLFGFDIGGGYDHTTGAARTDTTFRPVIWNK